MDCFSCHDMIAKVKYNSILFELWGEYLWVKQLELQVTQGQTEQ